MSPSALETEPASAASDASTAASGRPAALADGAAVEPRVLLARVGASETAALLAASEEDVWGATVEENAAELAVCVAVAPVAPRRPADHRSQVTPRRPSRGG